MAAWCAGWDENGWLYGVLVGMRLQVQTRQPHIQSEKYQCRIDTVSSPDDGQRSCPKHVEKLK